MRRVLARSFVAVGLGWLALPGILVWSHSNVWWAAGFGLLAGAVTAVIDPGRDNS